MKKIVLAFLIVMLFTGTFSCQERKKGIELIPNAEKEYTYIKNDPYGRKIKAVFDFTNKQVKSFSKAIDKVKKNIAISDSLIEKFDYALYINENGFIDKVRVRESNFPNVDKLLASEMNNWKMKIYTEKNEPHKYRIDWNFSLVKNEDGSYFVTNTRIPIIEKYNGEDFFCSVEKMPSPIGGIKAIQEKIIYPEIAKRAGIEGRVFIKAFVNKYGKVVATQIIKGKGAGLDEAAISAAQQTKFMPALQKGKPVGAQVVIPVLFKLDSKKSINQ